MTGVQTCVFRSQYSRNAFLCASTSERLKTSQRNSNTSNNAKETNPIDKGRIFNQKSKVNQKVKPELVLQNPTKLIKSDNSFNYESNHTSFTQIRLRIDIEISKIHFMKFLQFSPNFHLKILIK